MGAVSSEEASVGIFVDLVHQPREIATRVPHLIAMPPAITLHPVKAPLPGGSDERELCDGSLSVATAPAPSWATFEHLDIVPLDSVLQTHSPFRWVGLRRHRPPTSCSIRLNSISLKATRGAPST